MGESEEWSTVATGRRAHLVLLDANPLENIGNTKKIAGLMVRGRWLPHSELRAGLDEIAAQFVGSGAKGD